MVYLFPLNQIGDRQVAHLKMGSSEHQKVLKKLSIKSERMVGQLLTAIQNMADKAFLISWALQLVK